MRRLTGENVTKGEMLSRDVDVQCSGNGNLLPGQGDLVN